MLKCSYAFFRNRQSRLTKTLFTRNQLTPQQVKRFNFFFYRRFVSIINSRFLFTWLFRFIEIHTRLFSFTTKNDAIPIYELKNSLVLSTQTDQEMEKRIINSKNLNENRFAYSSPHHCFFFFSLCETVTHDRYWIMPPVNLISHLTNKSLCRGSAWPEQIIINWCKWRWWWWWWRCIQWKWRKLCAAPKEMSTRWNCANLMNSIHDQFHVCGLCLWLEPHKIRTNCMLVKNYNKKKEFKTNQQRSLRTHKQ